MNIHWRCITQLGNQSQNVSYVDGNLSLLTRTGPQQDDGPFVWDESQVGIILASYFWGYILSLMPGGMMAEYLSAKWVLNVSVLLNVFASLLMPMAAEIHYAAFIVMRIIQGIGGVSYLPSLLALKFHYRPTLRL
jgi:ACS family sodium-dependent inorganic phosphate cotransporter